MNSDNILSDLKAQGFNADQINQLIKFDKEGYKFLFEINPSISTNNIRFLRKVYKTKKFSPVSFSSLIKKINAGIDISIFFNEDYLTEFSPQQLDVLGSCLQYNLNNPPKDFSKIYSASFNEEQMAVLKSIIINDIKDYKIFNSNIPSANMKLILKAEKEGIKDDLFYDFDFSAQQLETLIKAKKMGVDIKHIANPNISIECMNLLISALKDNIEIEKFASEYYAPEDLRILISASYKKLDLEPLLSPVFTYTQRKEIYNGLCEKLDVSVYADPKFSAEQMQVIELFLENDYDATIILDNTLSVDRMKLLFKAYGENMGLVLFSDKNLTDSEAQNAYNLIKKGYKITK